LAGQFVRFIVVEVINRMFRSTARPSQLIVTGIDRNLGQPRPERRFMRAVISVERQVRFGKAVLNDLFNLFALRKKPAGDAGYLATMTLEQLFEGGFVSGCDCRDQCVICPLCE
jgi:hypothetical protein